MGGCCCSAKGPELTGYNYVQCLRVSEEQLPLPAHHGTTTILFPGNLVDTNLDTSIPDTYRPPPAPMPYNVVLGNPRTPATGVKSDETGKTENSGCAGGDSAAGDNTQDNSVKCDDLKLLDCKEQYDFDIRKEKELESDSLKSVEPVVPPEECPTCLEEYDDDNPKVITKCEHHFHLACILEWLERSDTCPVCDQEMVIDPSIS